MRTLLFLLIIAIIVVIAGVASGYLDIHQIRGGKAPELATTPNGLTAKPGQAPAFDVETGSVKVGSKEATVKVPTLEIQKPSGNSASETTNNSM